MSNYYTEFSFLLEISPDQTQTALTIYDNLNDDSKIFNILRKTVFDDVNQTPCFECVQDNNGLWIHSEDGEGLPELVALFLSHLINHYDFPDCGFEWANSCSKPRLDAFGGGAVWITKDGFNWLSTNNWLEEHRAKNRLPDPSS